jgi:hypothetical protein
MTKFTVKVRLPNGDESLYACDTIDVIGGPDSLEGRDMYEEGIFLDRTPDSIPPNAADPVARYTSRHIIQFGGDETADRQTRRGGKVWVMNEAGATVATYEL